MKKRSKKQLIKNDLIVKKSPIQGYGVFANKTLRKGDIIELCYVILCKGGDRGLEDYYFDANRKYALLTGYGIIYNHSDDPNADYTINARKRIATIKADRTIRKGEEILISYGEKWFRDRGLQSK